MFRNDVPGVDAAGLAARVRQELAASRSAPSPDGPLSPEIETSAAPLPSPSVELPASSRAGLSRYLNWIARRIAPSINHEPLAEIARLREEMRELYRQLNHQLAEKTRTAAAAEQELNLKLARLRGDVQFQERRLARLAGEAGGAPAFARAMPKETGNDAFAALFLAFENRFSGAPADVKARRRSLLELFGARYVPVAGRPLLDLACGRGEWLDLLREAAIEAYGIDGNPVAVGACLQLGLDARRAETFAHLHALPDGSLGALTTLRLVEHLAIGQLIELLDEARRTLIPGGILLLVTPNPDRNAPGAGTFPTDPTRLHPVPPELGRFLVEQRGFAEIEVTHLDPRAGSMPVREDGEAAAGLAETRLNDPLYGTQEYALMARRA